jgi:hypothetical protein
MNKVWFYGISSIAVTFLSMAIMIFALVARMEDLRSNLTEQNSEMLNLMQKQGESMLRMLEIMEK